MKRVLSYLLFLALALCGGCDSIFGFQRKARVSFVPEPAKVIAVIRATPGVDTVQYRASQGGPFEKHVFWYRGASNVGASLVFTTRKDRVEFSHFTSGRRLGPEWIAGTRPVMIQIETALEKTCDLTNLQASVVEKWIDK